MTKKRKIAYLSVLVNVLIWGAALPIVKPSLSYISPFQFLFLRYLIATPLMLPIFISIYKKLKTKPNLLKISLLEILGVPIPLSLLYIGLTKTTSIEASLIGATAPIFVTLGGILFLKEKEESKEWKGLILAFLGTIILTIEPILSSPGASSTFSLEGNLLIILNNLIFSSYLLLAKVNYKNTSKLLVSSLSSLVALIFFTIYLTLSSSLPTLDILSIKEVAVAVFYMGILGSPVAYTLYIYGQNLIEASEASLFSYLTGPVAIPFSMLILSERLSLIQLVSIIIIGYGVYIASNKSTRRT